MQASGSFELARNGRSRPGNLLPPRPSSKSSDYSWPASPSFNPDEHATAALRSPFAPASSSGLPPTPITAGLPPHKLGEPSSSSVRLPSVSDMLAGPRPDTVMTPPTSTHFPPALRRLGSSTDEAEDEGRFAGPRPQWVQDAAKSTFVGVRAPMPRMERGYSAPSAPSSSRMSSRAFSSSMAAEANDAGARGLGIEVAPDTTPRLGDGGAFGPNMLGLSTPTQSNYASTSRTVYNFTPKAPCVMQEGTFATTNPTSPIRPPLQRWNTDLRFSDTPFVPPTDVPAVRPAPPTPRGAAMEREQTVQLDTAMPRQSGLWGLGIDLQGTSSSSSSSEASSSRVQLVVSPTSMSSPTTRVEAPAAASTGLTPSMQLSRLSVRDVTEATSAQASPASPSLRAQSKKRSDLVRRQAEAAVQSGMEKRRQAQQTASSNPPSPTGSHRSGEGAAGQQGRKTPPTEAAPPQISPRKRPLGERDVNLSNVAFGSEGTAAAASLGKPKARGKAKSSGGKVTPPGSGGAAAHDESASPWGVFRLKSQGVWKPLGPPGGSKGVAVQAVRGSTSSSTSLPGGFGTAGSKKQRRQQPSHMATDVDDDFSKNKSRLDHDAHAYAPQHGGAHAGRNGSNKENMPLSRPATAGARFDVFSSGHAAGANHRLGVPTSRPGSAQSNSSASHQQQQQQQQQRRSPLLGLR
ncbi:unnamed protein product [Parajaminaea phylloscopi]